jgi:hypothetical protein
MPVDRDLVLAQLREQRARIERDYGLRMIGIVGSVARGEASESSDVDVFVDVVRTPTLFQVARAEREMTAAAGGNIPVEFIFRQGLRPELRVRMERDLVPL